MYVCLVCISITFELTCALLLVGVAHAFVSSARRMAKHVLKEFKK